MFVKHIEKLQENIEKSHKMQVNIADLVDVDEMHENQYGQFFLQNI